MNNCSYFGINIFNPIEGKLNIFIDSFISIYGEKYREIITERLSNAHYFFLGGKFSNIILKYRELIKTEIEKIKIDNSLTASQKQTAINLVKNKYEPIIKVFEDTQKELDIINFKYDNSTITLLYNQINNLRKQNKLPPLTSSEISKYIEIYYELINLNTGSNKLENISKLLSDKKKDTINEFFKALGYKNKNFNDLVNNKSFKNEIYNEYLMYQILSLNLAKNKEINEVNFLIADLNFQLDQLNITDGLSSLKKFGSNYINNKLTSSAFVTYAIADNSNFKSLCFCKNALELPIEDLTHEMGHIIDTAVVSNNKEGFFYKVGFEIFYKDNIGYYNEKNNKLNNNDGQLFNEIVNDYICQKVSNKIKENNPAIVLGKKRYTIYELGFEIFDEFIEKHFDKLIECKLSKDKNEKTYEYFGEKNFKELEQIAKEYVALRNQFEYNLMHGDKNAKEQIKSIKNNAKTQILAIEKKIDKNIENQNNTKAK